MRRLTPTQIALIVVGLLIAAFAIWTFASTRGANPDRLSDTNEVAPTNAADLGKSCGSQATYDLIKRELFRRAAALRGTDQAAFEKLAAYSVARIERPVLENADDQTGAVNCSGSLSLDLPPGVAVTGGRRTLDADIGYALQPAADGNGAVLTLTNAESIVTSLATLSRVGGAAIDPLAPAAPTDALSPTLAPQPLPGTPPPLAVPPAAPPAPAPTFAGHPSFNCAGARTRGEMAVCGDSGLAALDRQMAAQYVDALRDADPPTRAELQRTRDKFLSFRDQCPSSACVADAYRGRIREISDIVSGR